MKKIVYVALLCSLLFALGGCNGQSSSPHRGSRWEATLSLADSLMRTRPDSALKLLYSIAPASPTASPSPSEGRGAQTNSPIASPLPSEGLGETVGEAGAML